MPSILVLLATLTGAVLYVAVTPGYSFSRPAMRTGPCTLSYYNSMRGYDCVGLNLSEIPDQLSSSTEILDISLNRIRELTNSSFQNYRYLKKLYLNDNMIQKIEAGTFDAMDDLETLDLGMNALIEVPVSIFHMHSLQKLLLAKNIHLDILDILNKATPITAPIEYLDISYSPLLTQLPKLGVMLDLVHLNVTGNHVTNVSMLNFVGLCNLRWFSNENLTMEFASACDCAKINRWFEFANVKSNPPFSPRCEFAQEKCMDIVEPHAVDQAIHEKCTVEFQTRQSVRNIARICYIVFGAIGAIILVVGICYVYNRLLSFNDDDKHKSVNKELRNEKASESLLTPNNNKDIIV